MLFSARGRCSYVAPLMHPCFLRVGLAFGGGLFPAVRLNAAGELSQILPSSDILGGIILLMGAGMVAVWCWERRRRRRFEAELNSANERLRVLFDESPLSICVFDPHDREVPFRIVECNQHACDLHGWTREDLIGRGMGVLTPLSITYEGAQDFVGKLRAGSRRGENPHRKKDGTVFDIEYVARLVVIDGREFMIGVDRDLTAQRARRASEESLRELAELNELVLRASNDGIWDWDVRSGHVRYSERCRQMLGYSVEELPDEGGPWLALLHPEDRAKAEEALRRHWDEGESYVLQYRARHKDGNWRWIVSRGITLFDAEKRPVRMVGCRTDITEMKRLDAELLQSRKLRAVGEMVGGIAHEFNNLLTPMLLHAEVLEATRAADSHVAENLRPIREGIERARELTQRILTFGRRSAEAGDFLEVETVVRENLNFLARTIDRRIQIRLFPGPDKAVVWANRSDLSQLVVNLLLNARDTLMEKAALGSNPEWVPRVDISLDSMTRASGARDALDHVVPRRWHRLTVCDNGMGISEEVRERVFEPFFTTKVVGQGTGLGLATAWHVSMALGGWIDIETAPGEGTTFHIYLPAVETKRTDAVGSSRVDAVDAGPAKASGGAGKREKKRVLLVEDSDVVAHASRCLLGSFGHEVHVAGDGLAAWAELSAKPGHYDVVLTDLNLPGISGVELVKRVRGAGKKVRVVVYSGFFSAEHRTELAALGVDYLLQKPFTRAELPPALG